MLFLRKPFITSIIVTYKSAYKHISDIPNCSIKNNSTHINVYSSHRNIYPSPKGYPKTYISKTRRDHSYTLVKPT